MADTVASLEARIAAIDARLDRSASSVSYGGTQTVSIDVGQLRQQRQILAARLAKLRREPAATYPGKASGY